jgi:YidC/Oxa1 family membrane protein insertase
MSMFLGLRSMSYLPVESMTTGGLLWFPNLTIADPYYLLPLLTSATLYLQFKFAADGANIQNVGPIAKGVMKAMPILLVPMTINFPAVTKMTSSIKLLANNVFILQAITFYWFTTNIISVAQSRFVRIGFIREKLGIPKMISWDKNTLPIKEKGFRESIRECKVTSYVVRKLYFNSKSFAAMDNWRVQADVADRRSYDEQSFREAGLDKPKRTYRFDPTQPRLKQ